MRWAAGLALAVLVAAQDPDAQARQLLRDFNERWGRLPRGASEDERDGQRADLVRTLASAQHADIRAQLLTLLADRRRECGPRTYEATVEALVAYNTDGEVADAIFDKIDAMFGGRAPREIIERYDAALPVFFANLAMMTPEVMRARVGRMHPFIDGENPRRESVEVQEAAVDALGAIRAPDSVDALLGMMLALQGEMREYLQRASMLGSEGCDGG